MSSECSECVFYSMWDGSCMNPNSPYFEEPRLFGCICTEFEKEEES